MSDLYLARSGAIKFKLAPKTSDKGFRDKLGFSCNTMDVPYMFVPPNAAFKENKELYGVLGILANVTKGVYQCFIVAGIQESSEYDSVSVSLLNSIQFESTDECTVLLCVDEIDWDKNKDITQQINTNGLKQFGYYETVKSASSADLFNQENINVTQIHPYIVSVNRKVTKLDYKKLIDFGVVGIFIEAGYLYDNRHLKLDRYANPNLVPQVNEVKKNNLPYGFYAITRAKTVEESNLELDNLVTLLRTYSPILGICIQLDFANNQIKSINDAILDNYKKVLTSDRVGYANSITLSCNEEQLKTISWNKHCDDWYLWLDRQIGDVNNIQRLLTPETFMVN